MPSAALLALACLLMLVACEADGEQTDETADGQPEEAETETAEADPDERRADDSERGEPDDDEPRTEPSHADSADGDNIFHGPVTPNPDDPTILTLDIGGVDDELMDELSEQCREEIGRVTPDSYPDGYRERIYEHRLWQMDCLIDLGHDVPAPPSFDEFLDTLETPDSFVPLGDLGLRGRDRLTAEEQCPDLHQWEQQQGTLE